MMMIFIGMVIVVEMMVTVQKQMMKLIVKYVKLVDIKIMKDKLIVLIVQLEHDDHQLQDPMVKIGMVVLLCQVVIVM
jgi:hypothetical protein